MVAQVAEYFIDGFMDTEIACFAASPIKPLKNGANLLRLRRPCSATKQSYIQRIRDGHQRDWTRIAWWLERRFPNEFSRLEVAHVINSSKTTTEITNNLVISADLAQELVARSHPVIAQVDLLFANHQTTALTLKWPAEVLPEALLDRDDRLPSAPE
jgi:hypothetical protein